MQVQGEGVEGLSGFHYLKGFTLVPRTSLPYWEECMKILELNFWNDSNEKYLNFGARYR
jgi:hypothetical protein